MAAFMTSRICRRATLACVERSGEHVGGDAVDLGVELEGRDRVGGAGDLEVHVAERVLGAEDVGERDVLVVLLHEAHGDAGDGRPDRHTGVHQRQARRAHRPHRGRAVRRHDLADEAQRVGEVLLAGDDGQHGAGGERTVADLAALRRTDAAGLAVGPRRHVVVVQVALAVVRRQRVDHLVHARHRQRQHVHHLGLATLEQARAVSRRQHADLGRHRTQVGDATAVDAEALGDDPLADQLLGERADRFLDGLLLAGELGALGRTARRSPWRPRRRWRRCARPCRRS